MSTTCRLGRFGRSAAVTSAFALAFGALPMLATPAAAAALVGIGPACGNAPDSTLGDADTTPTPSGESNWRDVIDCLNAPNGYEGKDGAAVLAGNGEGNANFVALVTRAQFAAIFSRIAEAAGLDTDENTPTPLNDIDGAFFEGPIRAMYGLGLTAGKTATTYDTQSSINFAQLATFYVRLIEKVTGETLPTDAAANVNANYGVHATNAEKLFDNGFLTAGQAADGTHLALRGDIFAMAARAISHFVTEGIVANPFSSGPAGAAQFETNALDPGITFTRVDDKISTATIDPNGESSLTLAPSSTVAVGDFLSAGVTSHTPEGLLARVTSVTTTPDGVVVTTVPAQLTDVIPQGTFDVSFQIDTSDPAAPAAFSVASRSGRTTRSTGGRSALATTGVSHTCGASTDPLVEATFAASIDFSMGAVWTPWSGTDAYYEALASLTAEASAALAGAFECSFELRRDGPTLRPITFFVGVVPVVLTPEVEFLSQGSGKATAGVELFARDVTSLRAAASFVGGVFAHDLTADRTVSAGHEITAEADFRVDAAMSVSLEAYGAAGPTLTAGPFAKAHAVPLETPWLTIDGGVAAGLDIVFDFAGMHERKTIAKRDLFTVRLLTQSDGAPDPGDGDGGGDPDTGDGDGGGDPDPDGDTGASCDIEVETVVSQVECDALLALYNATDGPNWTNSDGWATSADPCTWHGVVCGDGGVHGLLLLVNHLRGFIPREVGDLTSLLTLDLYGNHLTNVPPEIGNLTELSWLALSHNLLTSVPPEIGNLTSLGFLSLAENQLTSLPPEIGNLTSLVDLDLFDNQLTSLPPEIGNLTSLVDLDLFDNQLTGLPPEIGNLPSLQRLGLYNNQLTSVPPEIGNLTSLVVLGLGHNQLTSVPPEIGNLTSLVGLDLYRNGLTSLPPEIGNLTQLLELDLWLNQLTSVPPEIGNLTELLGLTLAGNLLTSLPAEIGNLASVHTMSLVDNLLSGDISAWATPLAAHGSIFQNRLFVGDGTGGNDCLTVDDPATAAWLTGHDDAWDECDS